MTPINTLLSANDIRPYFISELGVIYRLNNEFSYKGDLFRNRMYDVAIGWDIPYKYGDYIVKLDSKAKIMLVKNIHQPEGIFWNLSETN